MSGNIRFIKLQQGDIIKPFESTDDDLNGFLVKKAKEYNKGLLATTYVIENDFKTIAYFSIFTDALRMELLQFKSKSAQKKFPQTIAHNKRRLKIYPALKIGRLAVCKQEKGYGTMIMQWIIDFAINLNEQIGCKFITVDAYAKSVKFYEKMRFEYFSESDHSHDTRQMYLDVAPYINAKAELEEEKKN